MGLRHRRAARLVLVPLVVAGCRLCVPRRAVGAGQGHVVSPSVRVDRDAAAPGGHARPRRLCGLSTTDARRSLTSRAAVGPTVDASDAPLPVAIEPSSPLDTVSEADRLIGVAVIIGAVALLDAGWPPVDAETEPDLVNFQTPANRTAATLLETFAFAALRGYKRLVSPTLPKNCRFVPTCSEYAALAIRDFGVARGAVLAVWRVLRCNPLGSTGYDPPRWPPVPFDYPSSSSS